MQTLSERVALHDLEIILFQGVVLGGRGSQMLVKVVRKCLERKQSLLSPYFKGRVRLQRSYSSLIQRYSDVVLSVSHLRLRSKARAGDVLAQHPSK